MPIQYQADYRTLRDFAQPEITPLTKRMSDITTLANLMDTRKANQMALAAAEKKRKAQEALSAGAQEQLTKYQTEPVIGTEPVAPTEPAELPAPAPEPSRTSGIDTSKNIYSDIVSNGLDTPETYKTLSETYKRSGLTIPPEIIGDIASGKMTYEQFLAHDKTPGLMAWDKANQAEITQQQAIQSANAKKQAEYQAQVDAQKAAYEAQQAQYGQQKSAYQAQVAAATPEARIPEEFRFMSPNQYQTYLKAMVEQPEVAEDFKKSIIESKKTLAEAGTQEAKSKDLKDYQIGSILNTAWKKGQTPEQNEALVQGLIAMGYNPVEARSSVDNAEALVNKYQSSPAMLGMGKLEAIRKAQEEKTALDNKRIDLEERRLKLQERTAGMSAAKDLLEMKKLEGEIAAIDAQKSGAEYDTKNLLSSINETDSHPGFAVGFDPKRLKALPPGTKERDFVISHGNLINQLALMARGKLKGQGTVSDYEGKMLKSAISKLDINMSPKAYRAELERLKKYAAWKLSDPTKTINSDVELRNVVGGQSIGSSKKPPSNADMEYDPATGTFKKLR